MESILAIGVGLVLRIVVDIATDNDDRVGGVLVGLWEGVVLNHFVRRMPRSFDPYLGFGFRIFVDFLFTQSLSRLSLVALWSLVGMLLADVAPYVWRDSGLRHIYRQVRKDVRHVKRAVPHIRIKNDLPRVRLFADSRSRSVSGSIRSDRAAPSRSTAPSPAPAGPPRRPGPSPPGTFPDVSGWSETGTDFSSRRENVVTHPGPSPAMIPTREHAAYEHINTTRIATPQTRSVAVQDTTIAITQTKSESVFVETVVEAAAVGTAAASTMVEHIDDPSHHDPPTIPDDWVDIHQPTPIRPNEPIALSQPDPVLTPKRQPASPVSSRPASVIAPLPAIEILPDIPDSDLGNRASQLPEQIPLPESRAASVIGGVFDQPQPRSALRDNLRSRLDKATSELGVDTVKSRPTLAATQSTKTQSTSRSWTDFLSLSKPKKPVEADAPEPPPKEAVDKSKLQVADAGQSSEPQMCTPAEVDPPASILTQPRDASPLLLARVEAEPEQLQGPPRTSKPDETPATPADVDAGPAPVQGGADRGGAAKSRKNSLFDLPSPSRTPPPPFTEFEGIPEGPAAGEGPTIEVPVVVEERPTVEEPSTAEAGPATQDPVTQDEESTELTQEQKTAEGNRAAFLLTQVQELEASRADLRSKLEGMSDPDTRNAKAIESDLEDREKTLGAVKARMVKKKFSKPPSSPATQEITLTKTSATDVQYAITSAVLDMMLGREDAGPMTIQAVVNKQQKPTKKKEAKEAVQAFAKRYKFATVNTGVNSISITF